MQSEWEFHLRSWLASFTNAHTRRFYETTARLFLEWCAQAGLQKPQDVKAYHLNLYTEYLRSLTLPGKNGPRQRFKDGGVHAQLRGVRAWFGYLVQMEVLDVSPFSRFKMPKREKRLLPVTGYDDFRALMKAATLSDYPRRNQAILALLFNTGIRVSELCGLRLEDLRVEPGFLRVRGKGAKWRMVPVDPQVMRLINAYIRYERPDPHAIGGESHVFVSEKKRPLTRMGVRHLIHRLCARANVPPLSAHAFRRGFVVELLTLGGDVATAQRILGHNSPHMTLHYAQMRSEHIKAVHNRASPGFREEVG